MLTTVNQMSSDKRQHLARPGHVSFDKRRHTLVTLTVESFRCFGVESKICFEQLAASAAGKRGEMVNGKEARGEITSAANRS